MMIELMRTQLQPRPPRQGDAQRPIEPPTAT